MFERISITQLFFAVCRFNKFSRHFKCSRTDFCISVFKYFTFYVAWSFCDDLSVLYDLMRWPSLEIYCSSRYGVIPWLNILAYTCMRIYISFLRTNQRKVNPHTRISLIGKLFLCNQWKIVTSKIDNFLRKESN